MSVAERADVPGGQYRRDTNNECFKSGHVDERIKQPVFQSACCFICVSAGMKVA
jgi:hypothetical protein